MALWVERVNIERGISTFVDEMLISTSDLDDLANLNWMRVFNSDVRLSDAFIVAHVDRIDWRWLMRPLSEPLIERYQRRVVQWDAQLYGESRTIEFLIQHQDHFNWEHLSAHPPAWFNEYHAEIFDERIDWFAFTSSLTQYSVGVLMRHSDELDWAWITAHAIRGEGFAFMFMRHIVWDQPMLDVSNLSSEFLYDVHAAQSAIVHEEPQKNLPCRVRRVRRFVNRLGDVDRIMPVRMGATTSMEFIVDHLEELDSAEPKRQGRMPDQRI